MKRLILLTNSFPYDKGETYLESEINYYDKFDCVDIYSLSVRKNSDKREIKNGRINVYPIYFASKLVYLLNAVRAFGDKNFYNELGKLFSEKRLSLGRIIRLVIFITRSHYEASHIVKHIKKNNSISDSGVIYSYRLEYQTYVALLIKKLLPRYKVIARGHRYDLYEYANKDGYIPLREKILGSIDSVICIAEDGRSYLESMYKGVPKKVIVSRLGTEDCGVRTYSKEDVLNLVSCSYVVKVKRIEKIIESLSGIKDMNVHWTHYGDGAMMEEIKNLAHEKLPSCVMAEFKGNVKNKDLMKEYLTKDYHLFLNVSESEGIPVSIMEALSFGIPVIATDVGGTCEIIKNGFNGILLDKDFNEEELRYWITEFYNMDLGDYQEYRRHARNYWEDNYDASMNYREFTEYLYKL